MGNFKLLCIGDSLTEAWNLNPIEGWTHLLADQLNIEIVNAGISGDTSSGMTARSYSLIEKYSPDCIFVMGGTNDLNMQIPFAVTIGNLMAIIRYGRKFNIPVIIGIPPAVYSTNVPAETSFYLGRNQLAEHMLEFQHKILEFAKVEADGYVDFSKILALEEYFEDGVHPNSNGHRTMSHVAYMTFRKHFNHIFKQF
jgi:lysophospholipase L1-like esterase